MRVIEVLLAFAMLGGAILVAQVPAPPPDPETFVLSSDVNAIVLHATVQDGRGEFVRGLTKDQFKLSEDGTPQAITIFSSDDVQVAVGLVIDNSGSMGRRHADVVTGALMFIRESRSDDEIFVVNFNDEVEFGLPAGQPFSSNFNELRAALLSGKVGGQTALYDAISHALDRLDTATQKKKVLLIVSDGKDNRSSRTLSDISRRADRSGVLMYTIGLFDDTSDDQNRSVLRKLARDSGGLSYFPEDPSSLSSICTQIAKDIRVQYTVGYSSHKASSDAAFHQLKLTAVDSRGRQLRVRTRAGYYGAGASSPKGK